MDEEIEHMQWQLDKRSQEGSSDSQRSSNSSGKHATRAGRGRGQQHVFHERHSNRHRRNQQHHQQHHHRNRGSSASASEGEQDSLAQPAAAAALSASTADEPPAVTAELTAHQQQQLSSQYYHLQLQASATATDLHKARDRLLKHILQDGGCYVSSSTSQAGALSHLLLFLQHRQVQEQQGSLLLLQPVDCERPQAAAAAAALATGASSGGSSSGSGGGSSTVVTPAGQQRQHAGHCSIDELKFWTTVVPLEMLLGMLQPSPPDLPQQLVEEAAELNTAAAAAAHGGSNSSSVVNASSMSLLDGTFPFSMESSTEEWQVPVSSSVNSTARVTVRSNSSIIDAAVSRREGNGTSSSSNSGAEAPLIEAAGRTCSATGALILAALAQQRLKCVRVGSHADANSVAGSVMRAVARGTVEALHVKGSPAAHAVTYTALELAAGQLLAGQQPQGFGVLLVPGQAHEHVHAVPQGHAAAGTADAAAAHRASEQHSHHHSSSRVHSDASMAVGGFGAAFYGISDSSSGRTGEHWLQHRHAQEMWLCVVPLALAE
jgi:hypothetical protein